MSRSLWQRAGPPGVLSAWRRPASGVSRRRALADAAQAIRRGARYALALGEDAVIAAPEQHRVAIDRQALRCVDGFGAKPLERGPRAVLGFLGAGRAVGWPDEPAVCRFGQGVGDCGDDDLGSVSLGDDRGDPADAG